MGTKIILWSCFFIGTLSLSLSHSAFAQEKVRLPWRPGLVNQFDENRPIGELEARLFKPAVVHAPFVVFMHDCGGLDLARVLHWAKIFNRQNVGVLMVDSYATRKAKSICENAPLQWIQRRADDAASALAWLSARPYVKTDRIAIMGQSQGGTAELFALNERASGAEGFVAGLAMYPACIRAVYNKVHLSTPVLVMVGAEDAVTPAADCAALKAAQPDQNKVDLIVYPGAAHEFDNPVKPYLFLGKYKAGEHPEGRSQAEARVGVWIDAVLNSNKP
jgi:dienelactone hydrolase